MVCREVDLRVSIEDAKRAHETAQPGVLTVCDVFEMPDGTDITEATFEAQRRLEAGKQKENNLCLLYYWNVAFFAAISSRQAVKNDQPAPLTAAEMEPVLRQLAIHPVRQGRPLYCCASDGVRLMVTPDGRVVWGWIE